MVAAPRSSGACALGKVMVGSRTPVVGDDGDHRPLRCNGHLRKTNLPMLAESRAAYCQVVGYGGCSKLVVEHHARRAGLREQDLHLPVLLLLRRLSCLSAMMPAVEEFGADTRMNHRTTVHILCATSTTPNMVLSTTTNPKHVRTSPQLTNHVCARRKLKRCSNCSAISA